MKPKYKWLKLRQVYKGRDYILDDNGNYISWAEDIPKGWGKAFGEQMIDELNEILEKYDFVDKYTIVQIKEKFGSLRWYDNGIPEKASKEYYKWLNKYEDLSKKTCIKCGKPATHMTEGWIIPLCDRCDK
jgi:hypothetical protein